MVKSEDFCLSSSVHCLTCSDEAIPGRVTQTTRAGMATVEYDGAVFEEVSLEFVEAVPGDVVLVHAKVALARLSSGEEGNDGCSE